MTYPNWSLGRGGATLRLVLFLLAVFGALPPALAHAVPVGNAGRPIRLEGFWDRPMSDPAILREITISPNGRTHRKFGITAVQAFAPNEEGPQIFRRSTLQPITLLLRGRKEMVDRFLAARPDQKVIALGVYRGGPAQLILNSVEVQPPSETTPTPAP